VGAIPLAQASPGDLVLCDGSGIVNWAIKVGQRFRVPRRFCAWNHVAILSDKDAEGWWVVEATGRGVQHNRLDQPGRDRYAVVDTGLVEEHRALAVRFAMDQVGAPYGWLTIASIVCDLLTTKRLDLRREGTWICSALGARALEHGGHFFDTLDPFQVMPAQLAQLFGVELAAA
jgi:uncharacterized protein YycO